MAQKCHKDKQEKSRSIRFVPIWFLRSGRKANNWVNTDENSNIDNNTTAATGTWSIATLQYIFYRSLRPAMSDAKVNS